MNNFFLFLILFPFNHIKNPGTFVINRRINIETANENAISPVIGVILMVAITVILAAVISAFMFGMVDPMRNTKSIGATATQTIPNIIVTYIGGPDHYKVDCIRADIDNSGFWTEVSGNCFDSYNADASIGDSYVFTGKGTEDNEHVVVVAKFVDGTEQVILDVFV